MKLMRLAALASVSLLAMTAHASADPISIGSFVINALLSAGAASILPAVSAAAIGNFVIGAAVIGANIISSALAARRPRIDPGEFKNVFETGDASEIRAVGRVRIGGLRVFGNTAGLDRFRLICHTRGRWTATEEHYLGGREVTVEDDGSISSPPWSRLDSSWVYVWSKVGDGTETAWDELVATFPTLWTEDHRVRGIAQSLVKYISPGLADELFLKLYQGGEPPYERVGRAEPIYDPREVGHDIDDETTWEWSDNGILAATHILRVFPSIENVHIDWAETTAQADLADAAVATLTGTEPRSRCWGIWPSEAARGATMQQVLDSIGAEIVPTTDGTYAARLVDDVRVPEITIPARHIIDLQWRSGPESVERPNVCRLKYYSPERNYELAEIDLTGIAWARIDSEIERVGEQYFDVDLPFCPSASQAQRIARRLFALARADAGIVKTNWSGIAAWGMSVAEIEFPDIDESAVCAIANPRVNDAEGTVEIPFLVWPELPAWNPAVDEAPAPEPIPDLQYESDVDQPDAPSAAAVVQYPDTSYETRVKFGGVEGGTIAEAVYRTYTGSNPNPWQSMTEYESGVDTAWYGWDNEDARTRADFRVRFFNDEEESSYFSDVLSVDPLAIDNTKPDAASIFRQDNDVQVSCPLVRVVSYLVEERRTEFPVDPVTGSGSWSTVGSGIMRPGVVYTHASGIPDDGTVESLNEYRVTVYTSNNTASDPFVSQVYYPPPDP